MADQVDQLANDLSNVKVENVVKTTFQWKVDVPEFVPRSMMTGAGSASSSTSKSYASVAGKTGNAAGETTTTVGPEESNVDLANSDKLSSTNFVGDSDDPCSNTTIFVNNLLAELLADPENVDSICARMLEYFNTQIFDDDTLTAAIGCLIESALSVENFAYLCVRVTVLLHDNYAPAVENLNFRSCLLSVLQSEHEKRTVLIKDPTTTPRLYTFAYVLSELSSSLLIAGRPTKVLAKALYELLDTIISESTDENVRFAIQTLKSVGAHLESVEKEETNGATPQMNQLIDRLECIGTMPNSNLMENTKFMIRNLRGVRRHWAYTAPAPAAAATAASPSYNDQQVVVENNVPYNSYGNVQVPPSVVLDPAAFYFAPESLSPEETAFYEHECRVAGGGGSNSDNEVTTCSEDDAIADAYEEFLSSVHRK